MGQPRGGRWEGSGAGWVLGELRGLDEVGGPAEHSTSHPGGRQQGHALKSHLQASTGTWP